MAISESELRSLLEKSFPNSQIEIKDLVGDQDHYEVTIKSDVFAGMNKVMQHKTVYEALDGYVGTKIHAMSLKTGVLN